METIKRALFIFDLIQILSSKACASVIADQYGVNIKDESIVNTAKYL